ncbi:hypothetical protein WD019_03680 [Fictibacillus sp. Mic-4]|uniref:hypothetical protein n=1 Tax=Fictibacillus sp. Mic-4 TaxID=3132826 RepID=UPI003CFAD2BF
MNSTTIRAFAAGIIVATGILAAIYYTSDTKNNANLSSEEVDQYLKNHNQVAISNDELKALTEKQKTVTTTANTEANQPEKNAKPTEKKEEPKQETVEKATLTVSKGMATSEVCDFLEKHKIIKDGDDFLKYLRKHKLEGAVRAGKYKVNSKMTYKKLADTIT